MRFTLTCFICYLILSSNMMGQNRFYSLWYDDPSPNNGAINQEKNGGFPIDSDWECWSLPIGNGYMGACIFGRTDTERIQISEKTFGNKGCYNMGGFGNLAEVYLDFQHKKSQNYKRELNLNNAIATVEYECDGIRYNREYFASYPAHCIIMKLKADKKGKLSFFLHPELPYLRGYNAQGTGRTGHVVAENDLITMMGEVQHYNLSYEAQIKVIPYGGEMKAQNDPWGGNGTIEVQHADSAILLISAATSYQLKSSVFTSSPNKKFAGNKHPHEQISHIINNAAQKSYTSLRAEHIADHSRYFNRVSVYLTDKIPNLSTDRLLEDYRKGNSHPYIEELLFQYGRYLLIASSRKGSLPANLQGVWSQYEYAPWTGGYWHNINVQMNYWSAFNTNLAEMFEPYVDYNEAFRLKAEQIAESYIKKNNPTALSEQTDDYGWTIGTAATAYDISGPGGHSGPGTGGFTAKLFWDYYDFTRDTQILQKHAYPAMKGMAKFLSKTLKQTEGGVLLAVPSSSPEQYHKGVHYQTIGCTFDQSMIWESFHDVIQAAAVLHDKDEFINTIAKQIQKLDAIQIGASGQIKEYREEKKYSDIGDPHHRHISHLCALYPGTLINGNTPDWLNAATVTLDKRGDKSTGWAMAHRLTLWARAKKGNRAYALCQQLLKTGVTGNLWGNHPPFQIDANFGATAGIAEMLLQSHEGYIEPLPALPDAWQKGSYNGLVARGNFEISVKWNNKQLTEMCIHSRKGEMFNLKYTNTTQAEVYDDKGEKVRTSSKRNNQISFHTNAGEYYNIKWKK